MPAKSLARRSAQTAAYHILQALVRWIYPILSFTGEEIWQSIYADKEKPVDYVVLTQWYDQLFALGDQEALTESDWQKVFAVRMGVSKQLEQLRKDGSIGSSLNAEVVVYAAGDTFDALHKLGDELRFVLITSEAKVEQAGSQPEGAVSAEAEGIDNVWVSVSASEAEKCVRCWHHRDDVGSHPEHPELCGRCVENVTGAGEERYYA